ncbi:MAG TPA: hypothetical protein VG889_01280 [Rhizomicrobium sp.]|nr:hypothetical protein [Rhizomicrobium sp.]
MNKLAVGPAIRSAYAFAFGQLGTVIGLIWLPMVLMAVLRFLPALEAEPKEAAALRDLVFWLAGVLLYAMVNVAVIRQALGLRKGGAVVHFALGPAEFRVWGATLLLWFVLGVLALGCALAAAVAGVAVASAAGEGAGNLAGLAVLLAGAAALTVAIVRLSFLYVPAAVVEERLGFERAWQLSRGNFWRIAAVLFAVTLPVFAVVLAAALVATGPELAALMPILDKLTPEILSDRIRAIMDRHLTTMIGVNLIAAPFAIGLLCGASAQGYRALGGGGGNGAQTR